jgi:hypothetical protein
MTKDKIKTSKALADWLVVSGIGCACAALNALCIGAYVAGGVVAGLAATLGAVGYNALHH